MVAAGRVRHGTGLREKNRRNKRKKRWVKNKAGERSLVHIRGREKKAVARRRRTGVADVKREVERRERGDTEGTLSFSLLFSPSSPPPPPGYRAISITFNFRNRSIIGPAEIGSSAHYISPVLLADA